MGRSATKKNCYVSGQKSPRNTPRRQEGGVEVYLHLFLTSTPDVGGYQNHSPAAVPPGKDRSTHFAGGFVGLRAVLDWCGEEKISCPYRGWNPAQSNP